MNRRCFCASSSATTFLRDLVNMSSHGERSESRSGSSGVWKINSAQIICVQVVPHLGGVLITMSSGLSSKPSHRLLS